MTTSKNFSVKGTIFHTTSKGSRSRKDVDGPWAETQGEAVKAFVDMLNNGKYVNPRVSSSFLAEKAPEAEAGARDNKGVYYNAGTGFNTQEALKQANIKTLGDD